MTTGTFFNRLIDDSKGSDNTRHLAHDKAGRPFLQPPAEIERVILCTGQIYYHLSRARRARRISNIVLVRLEQIAPFPHDMVLRVLRQYPNAELTWCQEEPKNQGAWGYVRCAVGFMRVTLQAVAGCACVFGGSMQACCQGECPWPWNNMLCERVLWRQCHASLTLVSPDVLLVVYNDGLCLVHRGRPMRLHTYMQAPAADCVDTGEGAGRVCASGASETGPGDIHRAASVADYSNSSILDTCPRAGRNHQRGSCSWEAPARLTFSAASHLYQSPSMP